MLEIKVEQGTPEWHELRLWRVTGTKLKDVVGTNNLKLIDVLIAEKLTNEAKEVYVSEEMQRGIDEEPNAVKLYEQTTGEKTTIVWFCLSNEFDFLWCSPDRLIKKWKKYIKGVEVKCPSSSKHLEYIRINRIPNEYKYQVINYFIVCEDLESLDFVSYDPRVLVRPIHIVTITREELKGEIEETKVKLRKFEEKFNKYYTNIIF